MKHVLRNIFLKPVIKLGKILAKVPDLVIQKLIVPRLQNQKISILVRVIIFILLASMLILSLSAIFGMFYIYANARRIQTTLTNLQSSYQFITSVKGFINIIDNISARMDIIGSPKLIRSGDLKLLGQYDEVNKIINECITIENNFNALKKAVLEEGKFMESRGTLDKIKELLDNINEYKENIIATGDGFYVTMIAGELESLNPFAIALDNDLQEQYVKKAVSNAEKAYRILTICFIVGTIIIFFVAYIITNATLKSMRSIGEAVHASAVQSSEGANITANSSYKMAEAMGQLKLAIGEIGAALSQVTQGSTSSATAAEKITILVDNVADIMDRLSLQAQETVSALRNSHNLISQAGINVANSSEIIEHTLEQIHTNVKISGQVTKTVNDLSKEIEEVDTILHTIGHITDQTNLLSLNATIEAARAGEHGRGFAVVAERIRKLSNESAEAAERIRDIIMGIQKATNNVVISMDKTISGIRSAAEEVSSVAKIFSDLQQTFQEVLGINDFAVQNAQTQAEATDKVLLTTKDVVSAVEQISAQLEETSASMEQLSAEVEEITATSEEILSSIQQAASIARNQATLAREVTAKMELLT